MLKKVLAILLCAALLVSVSACSNSSESKKAQLSVTKAPAAEAKKDALGITIGPIAGKTDKDYKLGGVFGGMNPYSEPMPGAANQATKELGIPNADFQQPQKWDQNEQNAILDGLVSKGIKGIYMMPSNAVAGNEEIGKLVDANIPVVCVGGPPELPSKATLTLATDVFNSAYQGTMYVIKAMGGKGKVVGLSGAVSDPNTQKRFAAIKKACKDSKVELLQNIGDIDNSEGSMTAVENLLSANGAQIGGIISTAYYPSLALAVLLKDKKYSHIKAVGIDTDPKVLQAIKDGTMLGTMSQNPWGQAYIGIKTLKMLADGWKYKSGKPAIVDSGSFFINKSNINTVDKTVKAVTDKLLATWTNNFTPPAK